MPTFTSQPRETRRIRGGEGGKKGRGRPAKSKLGRHFDSALEILLLIFGRLSRRERGVRWGWVEGTITFSFLSLERPNRGLQPPPHAGTHSGKLLQDTAGLSSFPKPYLSIELREEVGRGSESWVSKICIALNPEIRRVAPGPTAPPGPCSGRPASCPNWHPKSASHPSPPPTPSPTKAKEREGGDTV